MTDRRTVEKPFEQATRQELEQYARSWGLSGTDAMSDTELRKRLRDAEGSTGVAPESDRPIEEKGPPQPGHEG